MKLIQNNTECKTVQTHLVNVFLEVHPNRKPAGSVAGLLVGGLEALSSRELVAVCYASPGLLLAPVFKRLTTVLGVRVAVLF